MTNAGLGGDLAQFNDKRECSWISECTWRDTAGAVPRKTIDWMVGPKWESAVQVDVAQCMYVWDGPTDECVPTGAYNTVVCNDALCADTESCEKSTGATCSVSWG